MELREYDVEELPLSTATIVDGNQFILKVEKEWNYSATFHSNVRTYTNWIGADYWAARVSEHPTISYETMRDAVLLNHTHHEAEYIDIIESFKQLEVPSHLEGWDSYVVHYHFPFPMRNRDMAIWITGRELEAGESFILVTVPRAVATTHSKAHYRSVEKVERHGSGVKWTMAQTSDAGGFIPKFIQRMAINNAIAQDVPQFLKWIENRQ